MVPGRTGATGGCELTQPEPGHLVAHVDSLVFGTTFVAVGTAGEKKKGPLRTPSAFGTSGDAS